MREVSELVASIRSSWLCALVHACTWFWLLPAVSIDDIVDITLANFVKDKKSSNVH